MLRKKQKSLTTEEFRSILKEIEEKVLSLSEESLQIEKSKITELARRRTIVLAFTTIIEIGVAFAIAPYEKTISKYAAVYAFAPLVSAVSGNFGLQSASIVIRALAVGTLQNKIKAILREISVGLLCGLFIGMLAGSIAYFTTGEIIALPAITVALICGMATSGLAGSLFPQIAKALGFDPAVVAGPVETALQDFISYVTFLYILFRLS